MNKAFEKILERLEENQTIVFNLGGGKPKQSIDYTKAVEIVQEVAEEYKSTDTSTDGWIPCSERLPEVQEGFFKVKVLVVDKELYESDVPPYILAEYCPEDFYEYNEITGKRHLLCKKGWQLESFPFLDVEYEPIAWMPIPEFARGI